MNNYVWGHWLLNALSSAEILFVFGMLTAGAIFFLRDRFEGAGYQVSYAAQVGDLGLVCGIFIGAQILQQGEPIPGWLQSKWSHFGALCVGLIVGVKWWLLDRPQQWGDIYHHLVIAPLFCYFGVTLLPVIFQNGNGREIAETIFLIVLWIFCAGYDSQTGRLNQRGYYNLGRSLDLIKGGKNLQKWGVILEHPKK